MCATAAVETGSFDPAALRRWQPLLDAFTSLFTPSVSGLEHVPVTGPALVVGNHSLMWVPEAWATVRALRERRGDDAAVCGLAYDLLFTVPYLRTQLRRMAVMPASPAQAHAAFERGDVVMVYPGGDLDACRSWRDRDRIELGGRRGFIRLALRAGVPVVPLVSYGGQHGLVVVARGDAFARVMHLPALRVNVFPILAGPPFGVESILTPPVPLPASVVLEFLPALDWSAYGADAADDDEVVTRCYEQIRGAMQAAMDRIARAHPHPVGENAMHLVGRALDPFRSERARRDSNP